MMESHQRQRYRNLLSRSLVQPEPEGTKESLSMEPTCKVDAILSKASSNQNNPGTLKKSLPSTWSGIDNVTISKPKRGRRPKSPGTENEEIPTKRTKVEPKSPRVVKQSINQWVDTDDENLDISALTKTMQVIEKERRRLKSLGYDLHYYSGLSSKQLSARFYLSKQTSISTAIHDPIPSAFLPRPETPPLSLLPNPLSTVSQSSPSPNLSQISNITNNVSPKPKVVLSRKLPSTLLSSQTTTTPPATTTITTTVPKSAKITTASHVITDNDDVWVEETGAIIIQSPLLNPPFSQTNLLTSPSFLPFEENTRTSTSITGIQPPQQPQDPIELQQQEVEEEEEEVEILDPLIKTTLIDLTGDDDDDGNSVNSIDSLHEAFPTKQSPAVSILPSKVKIEEVNTLKKSIRSIENERISDSSSSSSRSAEEDNDGVQDLDSGSVYSITSESVESNLKSESDFNTDDDDDQVENERFKKELQAVKEMSLKEYELLQKKQTKNVPVPHNNPTTNTITTPTKSNHIIPKESPKEVTDHARRHNEKSPVTANTTDTVDDSEAWDWLTKVSSGPTEFSPTALHPTSTSSSKNEENPVTIHRLKSKEYVRTIQGNLLHDPISIPFLMQPVLCYDREEILESHTDPLVSLAAYFQELQLKKHEMIYLLQCPTTLFNRFAKGCFVKYLLPSASSLLPRSSFASSKVSATTSTIQYAIGIIDRRSLSAYERIMQQTATSRTNGFPPNNVSGFPQQARIGTSFSSFSSSSSSVHTNTGYNTFLIDQPSTLLSSGQGTMTTMDARIVHVDKVSDQSMSIEEVRYCLEECHPDALRRYNDAYLSQKIQHIRYLRRLLSTNLQ